MKRTSIHLLILLCACQCSFAQVDHYWSQQFGAVSTLSGGAMVAGIRDNSAAFYNPGGLAYVEFPNLSVDANIYKMDQLKITNGAGSGVNLNSAQMSIYPQILAGMLSFIKTPGLKLSWTILTRNFNNVLLSTRYTRETEAQANGSTDAFLGELDYVDQMNEQWFGLCASYKLNDHLGVGITLFGVYRGETSSLMNKSREKTGTDSSSVLVIMNNSEKMKYNVFRALIKAGLAYEIKRWRLGLTVTTPSLGLYGNGSARRELSSNSLATGNPGGKNPYLIVAEDQSVKATFYHPLSIGFGIEYKSSKTRIAVSGEYFFKISPYKIMASSIEPFIYPPSVKDSAAVKSEMDHFLLYGNGARSVFNIGVGFDQSVGKGFSVLIGAHTDFSSYTSSPDSRVMNHGTGVWDLYYVSAGVSYRRTRNVVTVGFIYGFTPSKSVEPIAVVTPGETPQFKTNAFAQSFGVVLGYTYFFPK